MNHVPLNATRVTISRQTACELLGMLRALEEQGDGKQLQAAECRLLHASVLEQLSPTSYADRELMLSSYARWSDRLNFKLTPGPGARLTEHVLSDSKEERR